MAEFELYALAKSFLIGILTFVIAAGVGAGVVFVWNHRRYFTDLLRWKFRRSSR